MATVQRQFEVFDEKIRLKRFEENQTLKYKRDIVRKKLTDKLPEVFAKYKEPLPKYKFEDQGSYEIGTGVVPLDSDYDIDQGLYFEVSTESYPDPVDLKERVCEALSGHTKSVKIRRSCVTVQYQREEEPLYHVDIAVYSAGSQNEDGKSRLAVGKQNSSDEFRFWQTSEQRELFNLLFGRFQGSDGQQFRRTVRYLKRWKDENFSTNGSAAPLGISLTVATYSYLANCYLDPFTRKPDDLSALKSVVNGMINGFRSTWSEEDKTWVRRLSLNLPVEPQNDLFARMTTNQMTILDDKLKKLQEALDNATKEVDLQTRASR